MSTRQLLADIDKNFAKRLQAKTGWGRNDVMEQYRAAVNESLANAIDMLQTKEVTIIGPAPELTAEELACFNATGVVTYQTGNPPPPWK